jgi:hypothetical protein
LEEEGGVVFSLSLVFVSIADKSLLDRFMRVNMPVRFVEDLDFFGSLVVPSSRFDFFVDGCEVTTRSLLVFDTAMPVVLLTFLLLEGEAEGEDLALCPRSPSTLPLPAA